MATQTATKWSIDPMHSEVQFKVKHLVISTVTGSFQNFEGTVETEGDDFSDAKINFSIDVNSINTRIDKRDAHLRSPDFFDASKFPNITFVSTKFTSSAITGNLTMKGVTKEVTIPVTISGPVKTMMGGRAIGITGSVTINRQDYGINWNKALDQGGWAVSNDVLITISIEADQK